MKTPEEMAEDWLLGRWYAVHDPTISGESKVAFLAGYQAAKDEDKAKLQNLEANWKFCCEDKNRLIKELAATERALDKVTDADKVMPQWISVKERLPEINQEVLISYGKKPFLLIAFLYHPQYPKKDVKVFCGTNNTNYSLEYVTHWMPAPEPPKE